jgi:phage shock protein E
MQKPIVVYCLSGGRSGAATSILQLNGVTEVYNGGGVYNILSIINN